MPHERGHKDIDYDPPPPTVVALVYLALSGVVHLVLAVLFEALRQINLVLGLLDIGVALVVTLLLLQRRKRQLAAREELQQRSSPPVDHPH